MGPAEVAERCGVTPGAVRTWRWRIGDFPEPVVYLAAGAIYLWPEIVTWLRRTGRGHYVDEPQSLVTRFPLR